MSGYLTRLVMRMTDEPAIRPRVASRFEAAGGGHVREEAPEPLETRTGVIDAPTLDRSVARAIQPPPADAVDRGSRLAPQSELASLVRRLTEGNGPSSVDSVTVPRIAAEPETAVSSASARPTTLAARASRALGDVDGSPPSPIRAAARSGTTTVVGRMDPGKRPIRAEARSVSTDVTDRVGRREPDVVQVHIGRVEVRAVGAVPTDPTPAARRVEGPRPLPLDRYLAGDRRS